MLSSKVAPRESKGSIHSWTQATFGHSCATGETRSHSASLFFQMHAGRSLSSHDFITVFHPSLGTANSGFMVSIEVPNEVTNILWRFHSLPTFLDLQQTYRHAFVHRRIQFSSLTPLINLYHPLRTGRTSCFDFELSIWYTLVFVVSEEILNFCQFFC